MKRLFIILALPVATIAAGIGCRATDDASSAAPTVDGARQFVDAAERRLDLLSMKANRADWVQQNFITVDTEKMSGDAQSDLAAAVTELALGAKRFEGLQLPPDLARKLMLLKLQLAAPAPSDSAEREELTAIGVWLNGEYGKGKYCRTRAGRDECLDVDQLSNILAKSRDPQELLDVWQGWHRVGVPMRDRYRRFVELSNKGARELGFADTGVMWRSNYDMPPDQFSVEVDRLWNQVRPLYLSLHAYVRSKLTAKYGRDVMPASGMIPAHLLGNMWAQHWGNIYALVAPPASGGAASGDRYDLTSILKARKVDERGLVQYGERFFTSLGYQRLPSAFWERSLFRRPADREVVCHASAWDFDAPEDVRIKMCVQITAEDFQTVHHELGHDYYYVFYGKQPFLFRGGANDGFHEAVGDVLALSTTPGYLKEIGLLDRVPRGVPSAAAALGDPSENSDLEYLLRMALDKVAFLPFGLLIDQWRWKVFSGEIAPADYNKAWWQLRERYQGVVAPVARSESNFDPGAKYHIPANTPYARYFLSFILQFQFHRALCHEAGHTGPLHRCSIYGNKQAGAKLAKMLELGASRPWPEALQVLSGESKMAATAILDYFAPLKAWLDAQNANAALGWKTE
jgi:peptidyl-dipeptidase A